MSYTTIIPDEDQEKVEDFKRLTLRDPLEILKMQFDPADILIENGYLQKGSSLTILGQGGLGKSRVAMQLAISCILGRDFLGWKTHAQGLKWLFLQTENGNRRLQHDLSLSLKDCTQNELKALSECLKIHTLEHDEDCFVSLDSIENHKRVELAIQEFPSDIVVFDVLRDFGIGDLNTDEGMTATCRAISRLVKSGNPHRIPIVIHHAGTGRAGAAKATGFDRSSFGRNNKALLGWSRAQINLAPYSPDDNEVVVVASGKANDCVEFKPFAVRLDSDSMSYEPAPDVDIQEWVESISGKTKRSESSGTIADVVHIVTKTGLDGIKRPALVTAVMDEVGCEKTKAYGLVKSAERKKAILRRKSDDMYVCK